MSEQKTIKIEPSMVYLDIEDGYVIFGTPQGVYKLEPSVAVNVSNAMLGLVGALGYEVQVQTEPRTITDQQRMLLINRVGHIMRSMATLKQRPHYIAIQIVDTILAQVM